MAIGTRQIPTVNGVRADKLINKFTRTNNGQSMRLNGVVGNVGFFSRRDPDGKLHTKRVIFNNK